MTRKRGGMGASGWGKEQTAAALAPRLVPQRRQREAPTRTAAAAWACLAVWVSAVVVADTDRERHRQGRQLRPGPAVWVPALLKVAEGECVLRAAAVVGEGGGEDQGAPGRAARSRDEAATLGALPTRCTQPGAPSTGAQGKERRAARAGGELGPARARGRAGEARGRRWKRRGGPPDAESEREARGRTADRRDHTRGSPHPTAPSRGAVSCLASSTRAGHKWYPIHPLG